MLVATQTVPRWFGVLRVLIDIVALVAGMAVGLTASVYLLKGRHDGSPAASGTTCPTYHRARAGAGDRHTSRLSQCRFWRSLGRSCSP